MGVVLFFPFLATVKVHIFYVNRGMGAKLEETPEWNSERKLGKGK
jgi:hypothetical protein